MKSFIARSLFSVVLVSLCVSQVLAAERNGGLTLPPIAKPLFLHLVQLDVVLRMLLI